MAKRFRFRLEPVLTLRQRSEDMQRRVVADRLRDLLRGREAMMELRRGVADAISQTRRDRVEERLDIAAALQGQRWRLHLARRIARQQADIDRIQSALRADREELARRSKDRKALETLRDRKHAEHVTEQARREQMEMDEIATQFRIRRQMAEATEEGGGD